VATHWWPRSRARVTRLLRMADTMTQITTSPASLDFAVEGMTCGSYATRVQRILRKQPGVESAQLGILINGVEVLERARTISTVTLMPAERAGVPTAIGLSRRIYHTIVQDLAWAFGYNVPAIPLASLLNPIIAGAAMGFSSVSVVADSLRLLRFAKSPTAR
jgi:cation transport ATPase